MEDTRYKIYNELRLEGELCDVVINVHGVEFNGHKIILTRCSSYFRALFSNNWQKKTMYTIPDISPEMMKLIIEYAYTRSVSITEDNVQNLLVAADQLGVSGVVRSCCDFLESQLCPENSIGIWKLADIYSCSKLRQAAYSFILQNFEEIARTSTEVLELTLAQLCDFIEKDELNVKQEETVFEAILRWIAHAPDSRKPHISVLLPKVRMAVLNMDYFMNTVMNNDMVKDSEECRPIIINTQKAMNNRRNGLSCSDFQDLLARPRLPSAILLAIGGQNTKPAINSIEAYDNRADRWVNLTLEAGKSWANHCTVYLNGFVYCIGGFDDAGYCNSVRKFDPVTQKWYQVGPMHFPRSSFSVAVLDGFIYAMGGINNNIKLKTAERYDPKTNQWTLIASMNERRSNASATTLKGKIYICGGFSTQQSLFTAECYDPLTNQWTPIAPMNSRRSGAGVVAYNGYIYAVGGFDGSNVLCSMESYDPTLDRWCFIASMATPRTKFGFGVVDDQLFVVGGYNGITSTSNVEFYDLKNYNWHTAQPMTIPRHAVSCCVVPALPSITQYAAPREP